MTYRFKFDRPQLMVVGVSVGLALVFAYAAGVVTGIGLWRPTRAEIALLQAAKKPPTAAPADSTPARPQQQQQPQQQQPQEQQQQQQRAAADPAPATPDASPADDVFSLQVGSFRDLKIAQQLVADLKQRGYKASVFTALDAEQREWHVVRIGGFKTLDSAAQAASAFTGRERMQALIRRSAEL